uniref:STN domain-containing protein n=1 Tax=Pedobacter sp. TaxID=1411316 RepID=UPI003D7F31BA
MNFYFTHAFVHCDIQCKKPDHPTKFKVNFLTKTLLLAFCITSLQVNARGQISNITLSANKVSLNKVLNEIRKQSGCKLLYNTDLLEKANLVSIHVENVSLNEALKQSISDQPFEYQLQNNTILITPLAEVKKPLVLEVKGTVLDEKGLPLIGASVKVKGAAKGTMTDANGRFAIAGVEPDAILVISYVGYTPKEVKAGPNISVTLSPDKSDLNEVIVIGYGTQKKSEVTGSISNVKGSALADKPVASFESALNGRATGVNMTANDGVVNQAPTFRIRGTNSLSLSS